MQVLQSRPAVFARLLAGHVGAGDFWGNLSAEVPLGWRLRDI
jgi:hypothetical protein